MIEVDVTVSYAEFEVWFVDNYYSCKTKYANLTPFPPNFSFHY